MPENDSVPPDSADEGNAALSDLGVPMVLDVEHLALPRPDRLAEAARGRGGRAVRQLLALLAMTPILLADTCGDRNACDHPPPGVGAVVTDVQAVADPCAGQPPLHVLAWFTRQGVRYPLRCGHRDPSGCVDGQIG